MFLNMFSLASNKEKRYINVICFTPRWEKPKYKIISLHVIYINFETVPSQPQDYRDILLRD